MMLDLFGVTEANWCGAGVREPHLVISGTPPFRAGGNAVIAVDVNVLIYANRAELPLHAIARARLTELAEGALPWRSRWSPRGVSCASSRSRSSAHRLRSPRQLSSWTACWPVPPFAFSTLARHWELLRTILDEAQVRGGRVVDAVIVTLSVSMGGHRPELRWSEQRQHCCASTDQRRQEQ
jgi:predicted nucleic acid-binding protein